MNVSIVLKKRRKDLHMSQDKLSELTNISMFRIGEFERSEKSPTLEDMVMLGRVLSLTNVESWNIIEREAPCQNK